MKNSSKTTIRRTLSFILTLVLIFIPFTSMVSGETISTGVVSNPETKLTENLKTYLETVDDDEYVPIYIWLTDYDEAVFYSLLSKRLGTTITAQTEEAYIGNKVAEKTEAFENRLEEMKADSSAYGLQATEAGEIDIKSFSPMLFRATANISSIMTDTEIENCLNSGMSSREIINLSQRNEFLSSYRTTRKALNNSLNNSFYKSIDIQKCKEISISPLQGYLTMRCKKSYLMSLASMDIVKEIGVKVKVKVLVSNEESTETALTDTAYPSYHMTNSYNINGAGIKIGIYEEKGTYGLSPHLTGASILADVVDGAVANEHITDVLTICTGKKVTINNVNYQGIAPNASIYLTTKEKKDLSTALNWFEENSVDVINMSLWYYVSENEIDGAYNFVYLDEDYLIDDFILKYRIMVVKSAGNYQILRDEDGRPILDDNGEEIVVNDFNVTTPGLAYNAITVGNVSLLTDTYGRYIMNPNSCYIHPSNLPEKPDISAFGTNIHMVKNDSTIDNLGSGTSFAAPQVTGAIALIIKAYSELKGNPEAVKAILLGSANENAISLEQYADENGVIKYSNNISYGSDFNFQLNGPMGEITPCLKTKSGAGLLNISAAIDMAKNPVYYVYDIPLQDNTEYYTLSAKYYLMANKKFKIGMVFDDPLGDNDGLSCDLAFQIVDTDGTVIFESAGDINNVDIFVCTVKYSGLYNFRIKARREAGVELPKDINVTLFFTCGECQTRNLTTTYSKYETSIDCDCGFHCEEVHEYVQTVKTIPNVLQVYFYVYYSRAGTATNYFLDYYFFHNDSNAANGVTIEEIVCVSSVENQSGNTETLTYNYEAIVNTIDEGVKTVSIGTVIIIIDYYVRLVTISVS